MPGARAVASSLEGIRVAPRSKVPFASAEDLILHKLFAGRPRDLEDAAGVVRRQALTLDWDYLTRWAAQFAVIPGGDTLPACIAELQEGHAAVRELRSTIPVRPTVRGQFSSSGAPVLWRPFVNVATGMPDATLVASPGIAAGSVPVAARASLWGLRSTWPPA